MPGKHVHFSEDYITSPTFSVSTLPSSTGPITPPPLGFGSPYHYTPLPGTALAHPLLTPNDRQLIRFDFVNSLTDIKAMARHARIPDHIWQEPATQPPVSTIDVVCPRLPWKTTIKASNPKSYVTLWDLISGLWWGWRTNILPDEYSILHPSAQVRVNDAYIFRCKHASASERKGEHSLGVKRIDFLMGHTIFLGIVEAEEGRNRWTVLVS